MWDDRLRNELSHRHWQYHTSGFDISLSEYNWQTRNKFR